MVKRALSVFMIVLSVLSVTGCATSSFPEKENSNDCLMIIPTEFIQGPNTTKVRSYYLDFSHLDTEITVPGKRYSTIKLIQSEEGNKLQGVRSRVTHSRYSGKPHQYEVNHPLPFEAGEVIIAPFKVVHTIERTKSRSTQSRCNIVLLSYRERLAYMEQYSADGALDSWF